MRWNNRGRIWSLESRLTKENSRNLMYRFAYHNYIWFGVLRRLQNSSENANGIVLYIFNIEGIFIKKDALKFGNFYELETSVLFREKTIKNLKKYMQTKEPFLIDVSYNILGEGQQFVDEKKALAYNSLKWPLQTIIMLLNRMDKRIYIHEGATRCQC